MGWPHVGFEHRFDSFLLLSWLFVARKAADGFLVGENLSDRLRAVVMVLRGRVHMEENK